MLSSAALPQSRSSWITDILLEKSNTVLQPTSASPNGAAMLHGAAFGCRSALLQSGRICLSRALSRNNRKCADGITDDVVPAILPVALPHTVRVNHFAKNNFAFRRGSSISCPAVSPAPVARHVCRIPARQNHKFRRSGIAWWGERPREPARQ